jgi:hypothetical protein
MPHTPVDAMKKMAPGDRSDIGSCYSTAAEQSHFDFMDLLSYLIYDMQVFMIPVLLLQMIGQQSFLLT